jgi:hypothetical protein
VFLFTDLTRLFSYSKSWEDLEWAWKGWRDASGKKMRGLYEELVALQNEAAKLNGIYHLTFLIQEMGLVYCEINQTYLIVLVRFDELYFSNNLIYPNNHVVSLGFPL